MPHSLNTQWCKIVLISSQVFISEKIYLFYLWLVLGNLVNQNISFLSAEKIISYILLFLVYHSFSHTKIKKVAICVYFVFRHNG